MKDARRLKDKIAKLAESSGGISASGRQILSTPGSGGLDAVLREIDETILPRRLTFTCDLGTVTLTAGNRRLMAVDEITGDRLVEAKGIVGLSMTRPDVADLGRLRDALGLAFGSTKEIHVKSSPTENDGLSFADGTTAVALAAAWGVDLADPLSVEPTEADPLEALLGAMPNVPRGWIKLEAGKPTDEGGEAQMVSDLKDFADSADLADLDMLATPEESRFIAIGRAPNDGECLVFVSHAIEAALIMLPADQIDAAKAHWRSALD